MVVIKSKLSGYYFHDFGVWTPDPLHAVTFPNEWDARSFIRRERIEDAIVIQRDGSGGSMQAAA
jgi:hypothetical protein